MAAQPPKPTTAISRAKASLDAAQRDLDAAAKDATPRVVYRPMPPARTARFRHDPMASNVTHDAAVFLGQHDPQLFNRARIAVRDHYGRPGVALAALGAILTIAQRSAASAAEYEATVPDGDFEPTATETDFRRMREALALAKRLFDALDVHA